MSLATAQRAAGLAFVIGLASALWSASGYVGAFGRAMNRMYDIREGRPIWKLRPLQLVVTLLSLLLAAVVALSLVLTGPAPRPSATRSGWAGRPCASGTSPSGRCCSLVVVLVVALLYYATPNVQQPKFRWISVGALLAIVMWIAASALFGFYVANFESYNKTYGALAGVVVFLLWLWITNLALLFGAELDAELGRVASSSPAARRARRPAAAAGHAQHHQGREGGTRGRERGRQPGRPTGTAVAATTPDCEGAAPGRCRCFGPAG